MTRLLKPLTYLLVTHPQKWVYDFVYPILIAVTYFCFVFFSDLDINFLGQGGVVAQINGLVGILTGFFIAALAAVSTFNGPGMDNQMAGRPFILHDTYKGKKYSFNLTRRRFLSLLFGYLSILALITYMIGAISQIFSPPISSVGQESKLIEVISESIYILFISNMFINTLVGIYYISYRIHRKDPNIKLEGGE